MANTRLDEETFLTVVDNTPLISIDLVLRSPKNEVLLGLRNNRPAQGYWFVPGGRVRKDERIHDAFVRLCEVELGKPYRLEQARFLGPYEHLYSDNFAGAEGISTHYVVLGYELQLAQSPACLDDQHSEQRWWSEAELLASNQVHPNTKAYFDAKYCAPLFGRTAM